MDFSIAAAPPIGLTKGVAAVNGSTPINPANTDHVQVAEGDAVTAYHSALGVDSYKLATCEEDYRAGQLHTLLITTLGWAFTTQTERGGDMMTVMAHRSCAALRDLGVLA